MSNCHSFICFVALFLFTGVLAPMMSKAQSMSLLLVNEQVTPVPSTVVLLPANTVYESLVIPMGTPVRVKTEDGGLLYTSLVSNESVLNIWTKMKPLECQRISITPDSEWQEDNKLIFAHHDSEHMTAKASNGLLTVAYANDVFSVYLGSVVNQADLSSKLQVFEHFSLHKSLHKDASDVTPYEKEISPEGWTRVYRFDAPPVDVNATVVDGKAQITVTHKFIHEEAAPIRYTEILTLLPAQPIIDYRSVFVNQGRETCYLGSRVNEFSAFIKGPYNQDMQVIRANGQLVNEGRLMGMSPRWFSAVTKYGYSLCFTALEPGIPRSHYFDFHRAGIAIGDTTRIAKFGQAGLHQGAADAEKWALFKPGEQEEIGVGVHVFIPGQPTRKIMKANWEKAASGDPMSIPSPLSVYLDGKPVQGGGVSYVPNTFAQTHSWQQDNASVTNRADETILRSLSGKGLVYRAIQADLDKPFRLCASVDSLTPGASLTLSAQEIGSQEVFTLAEVTEPGGVDFLLQEGFPLQGSRSFTLACQLAGSKNCEVQLSNTHMGEPGPRAPELISPLENVSLTDISAFYLWQEVEGCGEYELEVSASPAFTNPTRHTVVMTNPRPYFYPRDLLTPGTYYWRVRALQYDRYSTPGFWSEIRHFDLNNDHSVRSPIVDVSPQDPLVTMRGDNWRDREGIWQSLNETIKPHFAFRAYPTEGDFYQNVERYEKAGMRVFFEAMIPYGPLGRTNSLADMEYAYQRYPSVIGACLGENFYTYFTDDIAREYLERHHILAAKYGRVFHWADLHKLGWNELAKRPEYKDKAFAAVTLPLLKTTEPYTAYITQGHIAGWWLSGLANNTGTQADIWYWASVGFRKCGENGFGIRKGNHRLMPPVVYIQHWLLAMMQGGAVYANEWGSIARNGKPNEMWTRYFVPFFAGMIEHNMIPTREEFIAATNVIVHGDLPPDLPMKERVGFTAPNYGPFKALYETLYNASDPVTDFIPKNGRYGLIVVLPESVRNFQCDGVKVVSLHDLQRPEQVHAVFDPLYPETYKGDALVLQVGNSIVIMNSHENLDVDQNYEVPFQGNGIVQSMRGDVCVHKYIMAKHENNDQRFWLQANVSIIKERIPETRDTVITFRCREKPGFSFEPKNAKVQGTWDSERNLFKVVLSHEHGAVSMTLEKPDM